MDELLQKSNALQALIRRSQPSGPLHNWVLRHPMARELVAEITRRLPSAMTVYVPAEKPLLPVSQRRRIVAWNVDRGKKTDEIIHCLKTHDHLKDADILFLTETDWGMARSGNRNVTADIAAALQMHGYFAPAYLNLTTGHGAERAMGGENQYGLHGNSILSRYPLQNLRVVRLKNATDKFKNVEVRLGQQTVLLGDFQMDGKTVTLGCVHLDAYSSQRQRGRQLRMVLDALSTDGRVLLGGDFNTCTYNSRRTLTMALGLIYKAIFFGPTRIMRNHYVHPYKRFDRPVFRELERHGLDYRHCNELGVGTFDIVLGDDAMKAMASDKFPKLVRRFVEWSVGLNGGGCSTRLDWFATRGVTTQKPRAVRLCEATAADIHRRISDHHPIVVDLCGGI